MPSSAIRIPIRHIASVLLFPLLLTAGRLQALPPAIDGDFRDWQHLPAAVVKLTTSSDRIYVYLKLPSVVVLQATGSVSFYLDTDGNASTGFSFASLGAEYRWDGALRSGVAFNTDGTTNRVIGHTALQWIAQPVIDSSEFEISLRRENFSASNCAVAVTMGGTLVGTATVSYENSRFTRAATTVRPLHADVRLMTYNVWRDSMWGSTSSTNTSTGFPSIFTAVRPDVIGFTEIYNHTGEQARATVANYLPYMLYSSGGSNYSTDSRLVSRYPVTDVYSEPRFYCGRVRSPDGAIDMIVITAHLSCCDKSVDRANELASISGFVTRLRAGAYATVPANLPVVFAGDLNLVRDDAVAFANFQTNTALKPLRALQLDSANSYTWFSDAQSFSPGRLDYILTGSGLAPLRTFVFNSPTPPSDHLPVVADLAMDSDGNGLGDSWEKVFFGATGQNAGGDADGDGWRNAIEQQLGTSPSDKASCPLLQAESATNGPVLRMLSHGNGGAAFRLMRSENLRDWQSVGCWFADSESVPADRGSASTFYRAVLDD
jgi:hypothetical protein